MHFETAEPGLRGEHLDRNCLAQNAPTLGVAIPTQFLQQNIFGRMHVERLARAYCDRLSAFQLLLVK
jgi:hypothetical protein